MENRDSDYESFKAVCKKCKCIMNDLEPFHGSEFYHHKLGCENSKQTFSSNDKEIEPFVRKRIRRLDKRNTKRFYKRKKIFISYRGIGQSGSPLGS